MKTTLTIDTEQLLAAARALRLAKAGHEELLQRQVQTLPPGCDHWADTAEELHTLHSALLTVENACREAGA